MKKCLVCGKGSLLLFFSSTGLCGSCGKQLQRRRAEAAPMIQMELQAADSCTTAKAKTRHLDNAAETVGRFVYYLERGVKASDLTIGGRPLESWKAALEHKRREVEEAGAVQDERLKICPHCHGVQSKPVKRGRDCELCGKRIMVYKGAVCSQEEYDRHKQHEVDELREERLKGQLAELASTRESGLVDRVQILAALDERTCPNCRRLNNKVVRLAEAHNFMPAKHCTSEYCRCTFVSYFEGE